MEITSFCEGLLDALESFDQKIAPLGLYASGDLAKDEKTRPWQEWYLCLKPHFQQSGGAGSRYPCDQGKQNLMSHFSLPEIERVYFNLIKISKIKVRKYGSHYRLDKHENYDERWKELKIDKHLGVLLKSPASLVNLRATLNVVLFIGFDKRHDAFADELRQLRQQLKWDERGALYFTRAWPDRYERGFGVRLSLWARPAPKPDEVNKLSDEYRVP